MGGKRSFGEYRDQDRVYDEPSKASKNSHGSSTSLNYDEEPERADADEAEEIDEREWETVQHYDRRGGNKTPKRDSELHPAITHSPNARLQKHLNISDLRDLIAYLLIDSKAPSWVAVRRRGGISKVVALMVPGLELGMFNGQIMLEQPSIHDEETTSQTSPDQQYHSGNPPNESTAAVEDGYKNDDDKQQDSPDKYYPLKLNAETLQPAVRPFGEMFTHAWPIRASTDDRLSRVFSPVLGLLTAPNEKPKEDKTFKGPKTVKKDNYDHKPTRITEYIATIEDLQENDYPLHPALGSTDDAKEVLLASRKRYHQSTEDGWVDSRVTKLEEGDVLEQHFESQDVLAGREVFAIDCEMVQTAQNPLTLARISVVDWNGTVVLDELVKPEQPITDYSTAFSGITKAMLEPVTTTIEDIQKRLLEMVTPRTILIGHSLESDLRALQFAHPFIIDTALQYPHPRGPPLKLGLAFLAQKYLGKKLSRDGNKGGHNSIEDARAALELIKLKCWKGPGFGTSEGSGESIFKRLRRSPRLKGANVDAIADEFKRGAVIDWGDPRRGHGGAANTVIACESDEEVVEGIKLMVNAGKLHEGLAEENSQIESVDFVWARMRELEAVRGWWSMAKAGDTDGPRERIFSRYSTTDPADDPAAPTPEVLKKAVEQAAQRVAEVYAALPPCTAFIVYSGSGDTREVFRLGEVKRQFNKEYKMKRWQDLTVRWTDNESQALRHAVKQAREGIGFVVVK